MEPSIVSSQQIETQTVAELVAKSELLAKDTTRKTKDCVQLVQEVQQTQDGIKHKLDDQGKQLVRLQAPLEEIQENMKYSEKLLRYLRRCCCCFLFDSCTGADPEHAHRRKMAQRRQHPSQPPNMDTMDSEPSTSIDKQSQKKKKNKKGPQYRDPNVNLPAEYSDVQARINQETQQQNQHLDTVAVGVAQILQGAKVIQKQLAVQEEVIDARTQEVDVTLDKIHQVNHGTQLAKYR